MGFLLDGFVKNLLVNKQMSICRLHKKKNLNTLVKKERERWCERERGEAERDRQRDKRRDNEKERKRESERER